MKKTKEVLIKLKNPGYRHVTDVRDSIVICLEMVSIFLRFRIINPEGLNSNGLHTLIL